MRNSKVQNTDGMIDFYRYFSVDFSNEIVLNILHPVKMNLNHIYLLHINQDERHCMVKVMKFPAMKMMIMK